LVRVLEPFCPAYDPLHIYFSGRLVPLKLRAFMDFAWANAHQLPAASGGQRGAAELSGRT